MTPPVPAAQWSCLPFAQMPAATLYGVLALRSKVFVVEQRCIYQDPDGIDPEASLVFATAPTGMGGHALTSGAAGAAAVIATARLLPPGVRFPEPSIGRVCTEALCRGQGLGRQLMEFSIACARRHHPGLPIRISAQAYLQGFYESLGFVPVSALYQEDAIPHLAMRLAPD